jgi:hypothetical protein
MTKEMTVTTSSDDLADALFEKAHNEPVPYGSNPADYVVVGRAELRTLACESEAMGAKKALEDAAELWGPRHGVREWLRAYAYQFGAEQIEVT